MSNAKETPVPAATEQAAKEKGALTSNADYNTDSATLQEGKSVIAIIPPIPSVRERPKPRKNDVMGKVSNMLQQATALQNTGADTSTINAFLKGAMKTDTTKPRLKRATLEQFLNEMGIAVSYNRITQAVKFSGVERHFPELEEQDYFEALPVELSDILVDTYTHAEVSDVERYLNVVSLKHGFNPVLRFIEGITWDGRDRLSELFGIMGVMDELSKTLIHKWALQAIALLHNTSERDYSPDGMLIVNCTTQGIGKTLLGRVLAMKSCWFRDGAKYRAYDKDAIIESTRYFIAEFGEFGRILKPSQMEDFKAFVTRSNDEYRVSYAKRATRNPRFTSFYGTCNNPEFLIDDENRRFWVVPVTRIDLDALKKFDAPQFWRQVYEQWKREEAAGRGGECYRLTPEQKAALDNRNVFYQDALPWQDELETIIEPARADVFRREYEWAWTTVTDWMNAWELTKRYKIQSAKDITPALNRLKIEKYDKDKRSGLTGKKIGAGKARLLPFLKGTVKKAATEEMKPL